jgi:hypothetical protein
VCGCCSVGWAWGRVQLASLCCASGEALGGPEQGRSCSVQHGLADTNSRSKAVPASHPCSAQAVTTAAGASSAGGAVGTAHLLCSLLRQQPAGKGLQKALEGVNVEDLLTQVSE